MATKTASTVDFDDLRKVLADANGHLPASKRDRAPTRAQIVNALSGEIRKLLDGAGDDHIRWSYGDVATLLADYGVNISPLTLGKYMRQLDGRLSAKRETRKPSITVSRNPAAAVGLISPAAKNKSVVTEVIAAPALVDAVIPAPAPAKVNVVAPDQSDDAAEAEAKPKNTDRNEDSFEARRKARQFQEDY
jgi:hypothetical protein